MRGTLNSLCIPAPASSLDGRKNNFRQLLLSLEVLAELGPAMTAEREFSETATHSLELLMEALAAREGALFTFSDKPAMLTSCAARGYALFPEHAIVPLLPKHVHALNNLRVPTVMSPKLVENYFTANGNVAPELFKCIASLKVGTKLVGMVALGRRSDDGEYGAEDLEALRLLSTYIALGIYNHTLSQSLQQRITENLRLLASLHSQYDHTLEAFAAAIDAKEYQVRGHSLRVGRYSAGIGEAMGLDDADVSGLRAGGYLHDIGKVVVDKYIFQKPAALDDREFREMAEHTVVGHQLVHGVEFPWPKVPEVVRSHHERADGSGYPDHLHNSELGTPARVVAVADSFDAMTNERPYRPPLAVGEALSELVRNAPQKYDPAVVQALLIQVRRDATGRNKTRFLDERIICNIAPTDVDHLAAMLNHKLTNGRVYSA